MVCVPCVAIPILLIIYRFLIQPVLMKLWQMFGKKNVTESNQPELVKECKNGTCSLSWKPKADTTKCD